MKKWHIVTIIIVIAGYFFSGYVRTSAGYDRDIKYITVLVDRGLYQAAAGEYEKMISRDYSLSKTANLSYLLATVYYDKVKDYASAVKHYIKYRVLLPKGPMIEEVNARIIECLERLGKHYDSSLELDKAVTVDKKAPVPGAVVASIGKKNITLSDLNRELGDLPQNLASYYSGAEKKKEFLYNMLASELLYASAKKLNFETDKNIISRTEQFKKSVMVQELIEREVRKKISIADKELELYYEAKKDGFRTQDKKQKSFLEVREEIKNTLLAEKTKELSNAYIQELYKSQNVRIYEENIR